MEVLKVRHKPSSIPVGAVFGRLTIHALSKRRKKWWRYYHCICSCGKKADVCGRELVYGKTKSCGCLQKEAARKNARRYAPGVAASFRLYGMMKWQAKKRPIEFTLSRDDYLKLTQLPCHYCGAPPSNTTGLQEVNGQCRYSGLDRVDNSKGYTLGNVVPCCHDCNCAKRTKTYTEFITWAKRLAARLPCLERTN